MSDVFSSYLDYAKREFLLAATGALLVGMGLAFRLTPNIKSWGGYRYLNSMYITFAMLGALWLIRTILLFQQAGLSLWPLVGVIVLGVSIGFAVSWFGLKLELREST
ncbi:hypothetical protein [Meiothermus cerbereus]|uniref:hypothetical protein n=1 Tax=Meiothermus cerbereus TaxID=65552 RepID=UPI003EED8058